MKEEVPGHGVILGGVLANPVRPEHVGTGLKLLHRAPAHLWNESCKENKPGDRAQSSRDGQEQTARRVRHNYRQFSEIPHAVGNHFGVPDKHRTAATT